MSPNLIEQLGSAKVYDLEQPRFAGMPIHPSHRPGYFYSLHRRHRDTYRPQDDGPRTGASGVLTMMEHSRTHLDAAGVAKSGTLWAAGRGVVAVGADNMAWDVPGERDPDTGATLFAHAYLLPQKGVYIIENLNLEELARDRRWEFAFVGVPLKFQGATGSPLRPLALV